jgi:multisubunit Na+/H+ antiporter MnhB subunit
MMHSLPARIIAWIILAPAWTIATALLVKGHHDAGDGFSAGLMAGTGVLVHFIVLGAEQSRRLLIVRHAFVLAGIGVLLVLVPALLPLLFGAPPFTHYPAPGETPPGIGSLELHSGFVLDLGVCAVVLGFVTRAIDLLAHATIEVRGRPQ